MARSLVRIRKSAENAGKNIAEVIEGLNDKDQPIIDTTANAARAQKAKATRQANKDKKEADALALSVALAEVTKLNKEKEVLQADIFQKEAAFKNQVMLYNHEVAKFAKLQNTTDPKKIQSLQDELQFKTDEIELLLHDLYQEKYYLDQTLNQIDLAKKQEYLNRKRKKKVKKTIFRVILIVALVIFIILGYLAFMELSKKHEESEKMLSEISQKIDDTRDKNDQVIKEKDELLTNYYELSEKYSLLQFKLASASAPTLTPTPTPAPTPSPSPTTTSISTWTLIQQQFNYFVVVPEPTATPTPPTPEPISTRVTTINSKWTPFSAGDTVTGWAISINDHYFQDKCGNGVVLYNSPFDGYFIGGTDTPGIINPNWWEILNQKVISYDELFQ